MQLFLVLEHTPTLPIEPFTGSDIRRVVYWDTDKERAEQFKDVATLTCMRPAIRGYSVKQTWVEIEK